MEIHWTDMEAIEPQQRESAESRIQRLAEHQDDLVDLRIVGRQTNHHRHGSSEVRITCRVKGADLIAAREGGDLGAALHDALAAFEHELHRLRDKRRSKRKRG